MPIFTEKPKLGLMSAVCVKRRSYCFRWTQGPLKRQLEHKKPADLIIKNHDFTTLRACFFSFQFIELL